MTRDGSASSAAGARAARADFGFIAARDGSLLRTGVFTPERPGKKLCVLLNGHTEFIEKYREVIDELAERGFVVATLDWRGQGGSRRPLADRLKAHVRDFAEYDDDLMSFMDQVVAKLTDDPPLVLGHSLGSHLTLKALHDHPGMFRAGVTVAPMLAVATRGYPGWLARVVTTMQVRRGQGDAFAWGMADRDPFRVDFARQLCTSDPARFERTQALLRAQPDIRLAGPTWGWIDAAYRSMRDMAAPDYAESIDVPVLMFGAGRDRIVLTEATRRFAARLRHGRYVEFADSEHEILMECDAIRARFWKEFDAFAGAA